MEFAAGAVVMAAGVWIGAMVGRVRARGPLVKAQPNSATSPRSRFPWQKKGEPVAKLAPRDLDITRWPGGKLGGLSRDETPT